MYIRQSHTHRWIQAKAVLAFIMAISLTAGMMLIPLWANAVTIHPYQTVHVALEEDGQVIAEKIHQLLNKQLATASLEQRIANSIRAAAALTYSKMKYIS